MKRLSTGFPILICAIFAYGHTFTPVKERIALPEVTPTGTLHCTDGKAYLSTDGGIYSLDIRRPSDGWTCSALKGEYITDFVVNGDKFIATLKSIGSGELTSVIVTGNEVEPICPYGIEEAHLTVMANSASSPDNIMAYINDPTRYYGSKSGLARSIDGGRSWTRAATTPLMNEPKICVHPSDPTTLAILTKSLTSIENVTYVAVTSDGGATWSTSGMEIYGAPEDICFNPYKRDVMIAPSCEMIHITDNKGEDWREIDLQQQLGRHVTARKVFYDNLSPSTVYLAEITNFKNGHFYKPTPTRTEDESDEAFYFVIIRSEDGGDTWNEWYCEDLPEDYRSIALEQCGNYLLSLTCDGLDILTLQDESSVTYVGSNVGRLSVATEGNELTVSADSPIKAVYVTDIAGRTVATAGNRSGDSCVSIRLDEKGIFIVRVATDNNLFVTKTLL